MKVWPLAPITGSRSSPNICPASGPKWAQPSMLLILPNASPAGNVNAVPLLQPDEGDGIRAGIVLHQHTAQLMSRRHIDAQVLQIVEVG